MRFLFSWLLVSKDKSNSRFGVNQFSFKVFVYFFAQVIDVYIDKVGTGIKVGILDFFGNFYPADDPFCILHHVGKQIVFFWR